MTAVLGCHVMGVMLCARALACLDLPWPALSARSHQGPGVMWLFCLICVTCWYHCRLRAHTCLFLLPCLLDISCTPVLMLCAAAPARHLETGLRHQKGSLQLNCGKEAVHGSAARMSLWALGRLWSAHTLCQPAQPCAVYYNHEATSQCWCVGCVPGALLVSGAAGDELLEGRGTSWMELLFCSASPACWVVCVVARCWAVWPSCSYDHSLHSEILCQSLSQPACMARRPCMHIPVAGRCITVWQCQGVVRPSNSRHC